jgi:hypothetical protein
MLKNEMNIKEVFTIKEPWSGKKRRTITIRTWQGRQYLPART